jgi:hypothetical protein
LVLQEVKKLAEAAKAFSKVAESADSPLAADAVAVDSAMPIFP